MQFKLIPNKTGECARCKIDAPKEDNNYSQLYSDFDKDGWCWDCVDQEYQDIAEDQHFSDEEGGYGGIQFADPGGNSALRAATEDNPRDQPCPECHTENVLTPVDVAQGYRCDRCADRDERGMGY